MFASLQNRWWIAVASCSGLVVTCGTVVLFAFSVFLKPVTEELGISRSFLASGVLVANLVCGLATPFTGALADRWGSRSVLLPGITLFAFTIASFSLLQNSQVLLLTLFALSGIFGSAQNTVPYAKVICQWFDRERGTALGVATAGVGFGVAIVPAFAGFLISTHGWRMAYVGIGAMIMLFAFIPVLMFVREPAPAERSCSEGPAGGELPGLTATATFTGEWRFWAISCGYFLTVVCTNGTLANMVALLTDRGSSPEQAVATLSGAGLAMIVGRLLCGWCLDRFHGPHVAICFQIVPALGLALLAKGATGNSALIGSVLCGLGLGAHVGLLAFFASRYFGLRAYGKIYGTMFGLFLIGSGIGPLLGNLSYDRWYSYNPALVAFEGVLIAVSALFAPLGPYRFVPQENARVRRAATNLDPASDPDRQAAKISRGGVTREREIAVEGGVPCRD
jgi:MFS family permease